MSRTTAGCLDFASSGLAEWVKFATEFMGLLTTLTKDKGLNLEWTIEPGVYPFKKQSWMIAVLLAWNSPVKKPSIHTSSGFVLEPGCAGLVVGNDN